MKIYIIGAITGTTNYMERFECAELRLTVVDGYSVVRQNTSGRRNCRCAYLH